MEKTDKLVVVGYGFNDQGINDRLKSWIKNQGKDVLVVNDDKLSKESSKIENVFGKNPKIFSERLSEEAWTVITNFCLKNL